VTLDPNIVVVVLVVLLGAAALLMAIAPSRRFPGGPSSTPTTKLLWVLAIYAGAVTVLLAGLGLYETGAFVSDRPWEDVSRLVFYAFEIGRAHV